MGGTLSGSAGSVVLQNNGGSNLTVNADGTFTFTGSLNPGATFNVTVLTPPGLQTCSVASGSGTVSANITNVAVTCSDVSPPTLALTLAKTKLFRFAWTSVAGSTHYRLFEDPTGSAGLAQLGADIPASSTSIEQVTTLYRRANARYVVQACAASRCIDSNVVNVTGSLVDAIGYFKASNPHFLASFGISVALSADGATLAVGAVAERSAATGIDGDQSDAGRGAGAVYVFTRAGNVWAQQAYVKASNTETDTARGGDQFGAAVALSADGSVLAVGANREDSAATGVDRDQFDNSAPDSGAVYVFSRVGAAWSQQAYIKASNTQDADRFGSSLALSGDGRTLAVSAIGEDGGGGAAGENDDSADDSGAVYVFTRPADRWAQQAYLKASNTQEFDDFGTSLALSTDGRTLAVGAPGEDSGAIGANGSQNREDREDSGAVYVFGRSGAVWSQAYLKASNTDEEDFFGVAVALSADGSMLGVGADGEDGSGGAAGESDNSADGSGAVYLFARAANNVWAPSHAYLKASNVGEFDRFGSAVALSADGQTVVVGAPGEGSTARGIGGDETDNSAPTTGAAYAFARSGASWTQQAYIKPSNSGVSTPAVFGELALSGDATVLAVGAHSEDSNSPGINGDEDVASRTFSGAVYVY